MKLAWLCYTHTYDLEAQEILIRFERPERWEFAQIVQIVYAEIKE